MNQSTTPTPALTDISAGSDAPADTARFDEIDAILDDLRTRYDETPQWEFCEGFMAALICCRRAIPQPEPMAAKALLPMPHSVCVFCNCGTSAGPKC